MRLAEINQNRIRLLPYLKAADLLTQPQRLEGA